MQPDEKITCNGSAFAVYLSVVGYRTTTQKVLLSMRTITTILLLTLLAGHVSAGKTATVDSSKAKVVVNETVKKAVVVRKDKSSWTKIKDLFM